MHIISNKVIVLLEKEAFQRKIKSDYCFIATS